MAASGTPKYVKIGGVKLFPDADCSAKLPGGVYEVEAVSHAGGNQKQMKRTSGAITGFSFTASKATHVKLQTLNDDPDENLTLSYKDVAGNIFRTNGFIKYDGMEDATNKGTVDLIPISGEWALFEP